MGIPEIARRYIVRYSAEEGPTEGEVPAGFAPVTIAEIQCYINGKQLKAKYGMATEAN